MDKELWKEKLKNWYKEHSEKLKIDEEKMKDIVSNDEYITWLCNYLNENHYLSDDDWMYFPDKIKEEDRINASKMCLLYQIVDKYAINNNINPVDDRYGHSYIIGYCDYVFDLGVRLDEGVKFYCIEGFVYNNSELIDFNSLIEPKEKSKILIK